MIETPFPDHPALSLTLAEHDAKLAEDRDGSLLKVVIKNKLPCVRSPPLQQSNIPQLALRISLSMKWKRSLAAARPPRYPSWARELP